MASEQPCCHRRSPQPFNTRTHGVSNSATDANLEGAEINRSKVTDKSRPGCDGNSNGVGLVRATHHRDKRQHDGIVPCTDDKDCAKRFREDVILRRPREEVELRALWLRPLGEVLEEAGHLCFRDSDVVDVRFAFRAAQILQPEEW